MVSQRPQSPRPRWLLLLRPPLLTGILSVGIHGLLFAAGPQFSSLNLNALADPNADAEQRQVPLIELSPQEQSRLPDFSSTFYDLQPLPGDTDSPRSPLDPAWPSDSPPSASSLPENGDLPSQNQPLPSISRWPLSQLPRQRPQPRPQTQPSDSLPPGPAATPPPTTAPEVAPNTAIAPDTTSSTPLTAPPSEPSAADLRPQPSPSPDTARGATSTAASGETSPQAAPSLAERLQAYAYSSTQTTGEEAETALEDWLAATQETANLPEPPPLEAPVEIPLNYGQRPCLPQSPQNALVGALVNPAGQLAETPQLLRSSGYPFLNRRAVAIVAEAVDRLSFNELERLTAYQFEIVMNYNPDLCVNIDNLSGAAE